MVTTLLSKLSDTVSSDPFTTTTTTTSSGSLPAVVWVLILVVAILMVVSMWKVFQKAGKPGWAAIIPVYNLWVLFEIAGKPGWWSLLAFIPLVNIVVLVLEIIAMIEVGRRFGKSGVWGFFLLFLLPFIGWPILGFGSAQYQGVSAAAAPTGPAPTPPTNPTPPVDTVPVSTPPTNQQPPTTPVQ